MKLELQNVLISNIDFADETKIVDGTLFINKEEMKATILKDKTVKSVEIDLARPG